MGTIAVIGAGPKAAAISAKAAVLAAHLPNVPQIVVFERTAVAAAWRGGSGYTDGLQPLCTLAERDLGFPYDRFTYGSLVAQEMFAKYSWPAFAVREGQGHAGYEQWVLQGRNPPSHHAFADYLASAIGMSGARVVERAEVKRLEFDGTKAQWKVSYVDQHKTPRHEYHDAVVVTGSGPPIDPLSGAFVGGVRNPRVFDGLTFWTHLDEIKKIIDADDVSERRIVLIGAGGTAAAIAHWFVRARIDVPITIIGLEATLYARHPGYFEDRLFSDESAWERLAPHSRDEFVRRLTTGVVWDYVLKNIQASRMNYECADAVAFRTASTPSTGPHPEVLVEVRPPRAPGAVTAPPSSTPIAGSVFVDARGFNRFWFSSFLQPPHDTYVQRSNQDAITASVDDSLRIGSLPTGLHAPMLASRQGPAAGNLMALGWMSDRILRAYVTPPTPRWPAVPGSSPAGGSRSP